MNQLFYPTIDLFTYDLKSALNLKPEEIEQQRKDFVAKFPPEIRSNFHDSETETEYHPLFTDLTTGENEFDLKPHNPDLEGLRTSALRWSNPKRKRLLARRPCFLITIGLS